MSDKNKNTEEVKDQVEEILDTQDTEEQTTEEVDVEVKLQEELDKEKDKFLRLFAEFENYKKRTSKERLELFKTASQDVMVSMLPVLDDFDRALKEIEKSEDKEASRFLFIFQACDLWVSATPSGGLMVVGGGGAGSSSSIANPTFAPSGSSVIAMEEEERAAAARNAAVPEASQQQQQPVKKSVKIVEAVSSSSGGGGGGKKTTFKDVHHERTKSKIKVRAEERIDANCGHP